MAGERLGYRSIELRLEPLLCAHKVGLGLDWGSGSIRKSNDWYRAFGQNEMSRQWSYTQQLQNAVEFVLHLNEKWGEKRIIGGIVLVYFFWCDKLTLIFF